MIPSTTLAVAAATQRRPRAGLRSIVPMPRRQLERRARLAGAKRTVYRGRRRRGI